MKHPITRLISLLLVLSLCISMLPMEAFAWGKMTHIYTANLIEGEILNGNNSIAVGDSIFEYDIPDEYYEAIMAYPDYFRAGALGPDVYPDILTGQLYIHPEDDGLEADLEDFKVVPNPENLKVDTGIWVTYLCEAVNKMGKDTEDRKKCLSFVLGCILHYCGDLYGHDFVNTFSGGSFPSFFSAEIFDITSERLNNILSHLSTESYMDELIYPNYDVNKDGDINGPDKFIAGTMVFDGTPAAGLNPIYGGYPATITDKLADVKAEIEDIILVGDLFGAIIDDIFNEEGNNVPPHYTAMLNLRTFLTSTADEYREHMEPVSAGITAFCDAWAEDVDKGIIEFTATCDRIARRIVTGEKNPEIEKKSEEERKEEQNKIWVAFGVDMDEVNLKSLIGIYRPTENKDRVLKELNDAGIYGDSFFDIILAELVLQGAITTEMLKTNNSSIMIIKEELSHWMNEYGNYMLFIPDFIIDGIEIPFVGDFLDVITALIKAPLYPVFELTKSAIKDMFASWVISYCTGTISDVTGWEEEKVPDNLKEIVEKITERLDDPQVQLDHEDNPYQPSENNFAELKEYMDILAGEVAYEVVDSDFEALYNSIVMFKLILMGPENYSKLTKTYAGVDQTSYQMNTASPEVTSLKVKIKTSDLYLAGTDDNIYLIVYENGSGSKDFKKTQVLCKLLDLSGTNDFESGDTAVYTVELPRSVKLSQLEIALKKTPAFDFLPGITDDWRCENIRVTPMFAGYELTAPVDLGGIFLQGSCEFIGMNFQKALKARFPEDPKSQIVTNLQVQIKVRDKLYAGTDSDIYLKVYNNGSLYQSVLLDKAMYNDLEQGDNDIYNIPIVRPGTESQGIPLNRLTVKFDHTGSDEANWEVVSITPCYGDIKLTDAISVGGKTFEKASWKPEFQNQLKKATYRQEPNMAQTATSLEVQINVSNDLGAGTDDDIYLNIYSSDSTSVVQRILLDKDGYNDFEMGDSDIYTIALNKTATKIPLDQMRLVFERVRKYPKTDEDGNPNLFQYEEDTKWDDVLVTPYNGDKALTDAISVGGTEFEDDFWDTEFQTQLKMHYTPVVLEYTTNLDGGLLSYMGSLDGGEEWVDEDNELWENTTLRTEVFFKIFKGFAPEIEYTGSESIQKGKAAEIKLNFTGMWNGVSNERRSQVKEFEHVYAVAGTVDVDFIDDNGKSVLKTTGVKVADNQASITIPYNENMAPGSYDIKVTYHPDKAKPVYAGTEAVFEDTLVVTVPDKCYITVSASPDDGGSVKGEGFYKYEESCTVTAQPNAGYEFVEWRNDTGAVSKSTSYTFTVVENCKLVAVFKEISSEFTSVINDGKERAEISMGEAFALYVKNEGGTAPYTYEWQYLEPGKTVWVRGTTGNSVSLIGNDTVNGRRYRVQVTDANGKKSISNEVIIIVKGGKFAVQINDGAPEIVFEDNVNSAAKTLEANITGGIGPYTYKWYIFNSGAWQLVSEAATYKLSPNGNYDKDKIKVEVTDSTGKQTTSEEVTIKFNKIIVN